MGEKWETAILILVSFGLALILIPLICPFCLPSEHENIELPDETMIAFSVESNLLRNPSFEEFKNGESIPVAWEYLVWADSASFSSFTGEAKTGNYSVMIQSNYTSVRCAWRTPINQMPDVIPGKNYEARAFVKIDSIGPDGVHIAIAWYDSEGRWISVVSGGLIFKPCDWKEIVVSGLAPEDAVKASVELHMNDRGSALFDDVSLKTAESSYVSEDGLWQVRRKGLISPVMKSENGVLTLQATFASLYDEFLVFQKTTYIDPSKYPYLTLSWRTATTFPGAPGFFLEFVTMSNKSEVQPMGLSKNWATTTINLNNLVRGESVVALKMYMNDWNDNVYEGEYFVQVRALKNVAVGLKSLLLFVGGCAVFLSAVVNCYRTGSKRKSLLNATLIFGTISLCSALPFVITPFIELRRVEIVVAIFGILTCMCLLLEGKGNNINYTSEDAKQASGIRRDGNTKFSSKKVVMMVGLLIVPWIAFLLRLNAALTNNMFGDELSYGLTSWGILNGRGLIGAHFPGPWQPPANGVFKFQPYPEDLPLPYTRDWMFSLKIVSPFFAIPYFMPLLATPFIALFGFSQLTIRLPYILMSVATVLCVFLIGRRFSSLAALIGEGFFAFSPFSVKFGSQAFVTNGAALFFMVTILLYLNYRQTGKRHHIYLAAVAAGLSLLCRATTVYATLFLVLALILDSASPREIIKVLSISLSILATFIVSGVIISYSGFVLSLEWLIGLSQTFLELQMGLYTPTPLQLITYWETALCFSCFLFVLGYVWTQRGKGNTFTRLTAIGLLSFLLPTIILFGGAKPWWLINVLPVLSLSLGQMVSIVRRENLIIPGSVFTLVLLTLSFKHFYFVELFNLYRYLLIGSFVIITLVVFVDRYTNFFSRVPIGFARITKWYGNICTAYIILSLAMMCFQIIYGGLEFSLLVMTF